MRSSLLGLVLRLSWQTLRRHHVFNPVLDGNLDRIGFPIGFVLGNLVLLAAVPINHGPDELVRVDRRLDLALAIRQFHQRTHHVGLGALDLERVVDAPESPHPRHVMLGNVAMEHELTGKRLQTAGPTFVHLIKDFGRPDGLHVETIRRIADRREFDRTVFADCPIKPAGLRLARPPNRAAMEMVRMDDLGPADQPKLGGVSQVGPWHRRGRIAKGIGPIALGFIREPDQVVLKFQPSPVRLAPHVEQPRGRTICIGVRVALRQHLPLAVQQPEGLIPGLMVENHELAEV